MTWLNCVGGPFNGRRIQYPDTPRIIVLMEYPFRYHDYRRTGPETFYVYRYVERST